LFYEAHHLSKILEQKDSSKIPPHLQYWYEMGGLAEMMAYGSRWTLEFERKYEDRVWTGEWWEEMEAFFQEKIVESQIEWQEMMDASARED
jgi:hypothetical protein